MHAWYKVFLINNDYKKLISVAKINTDGHFTFKNKISWNPLLILSPKLEQQKRKLRLKKVYYNI